MPEKTIVKNSAVPESAGNSQDAPQSGEGQSPSKELENKVRENLRSEYDRKLAQQLETVNAEKEELSSRLEELEEKMRLTTAERAEKTRLEGQIDGLDAELHELEVNPRYRAYNEKIKRSMAQARQEAKEDAIHEISVEHMKEFIEEKAEELKMTSKELEKELTIICQDGRYRAQLPHLRAKKAFRDILEKRALAKDREELRAEKEKLNAHSEGTGREPIFDSYQTAREKGSLIDRLRAVGQYKKD